MRQTPHLNRRTQKGDQVETGGTRCRRISLPLPVRLIGSQSDQQGAVKYADTLVVVIESSISVLRAGKRELKDWWAWHQALRGNQGVYMLDTSSIDLSQLSTSLGQRARSTLEPS